MQVTGLLLVALLGSEQKAARPYPVEDRFALGLPLGFGYTISGVSTSSQLSHDFFFSFRPSLTWSPTHLRNFGAGVYSEVGTLRTFRDFHLAIGLEARGPGKSNFKPVLSVGACLNHDGRRPVAGLEVGVYFGHHDPKVLSAIGGLKVTGRHHFGSTTAWAVTVAVELDLGLIWVLLPKGGGWIM